MKNNLFLVSLAALSCTGMVSADAPVKQEKSDVAKALQTGIDTDLKVRYIDTFTAMRSSGAGQEEAQKLEKEAQEKTMEVQQKGQEIAKRMKDYESKAPTMSDSAREREEKELLSEKRSYELERKSAEEDMKLASQRATERLLKELEEAVQEIAKAEGLDVIADGATGRVVYASDKADYTAKIVNQMDKQRNVKLAQTKKAVTPVTTIAKGKTPETKTTKA